MDRRVTMATGLLGLMLLWGCASLQTDAGKFNPQPAYDYLAYANRLAVWVSPVLNETCISTKATWACRALEHWQQSGYPAFVVASDALTKALGAYQQAQDASTADQVRIALETLRQVTEQVLALVYGGK